MNTNLNDKDKAMDTAIRFQKKMRIPKFFFLIFGTTIILAFIQDVITGSNFLQTTIMQIIFAIYLGFGGIIILFYIIIAGICPYCHEFQKMNYGTSVGIGADSFTFFKGISLVLKIDYCSKCGKPLSPETVNKVMNDETDEEKTDIVD